VWDEGEDGKLCLFFLTQSLAYSVLYLSPDVLTCVQSIPPTNAGVVKGEMQGLL